MQTYLSRAKNIKNMLAYFQSGVIEELKEMFPNVVLKENIFLGEALEKIYSKTGEQFIFVIDEWDCVLREKGFSQKDYTEYLDYLRNLLKDQVYVALAYMTGILPIKKYGSHSALNMFFEYSMTNPNMFEEYVGFTETEVLELCREYKMDLEEMMNWYDGYSFETVPHVYNPKSVVEAIIRKQFGSYWTRTETHEALKCYIDMNLNGLKDAITCMFCWLVCYKKQQTSIQLKPLYCKKANLYIFLLSKWKVLQTNLHNFCTERRRTVTMILGKTRINIDLWKNYYYNKNIGFFYRNK